MARVDAGMVTSGLEIPGYRVVRNFGIVRGIIVLSRSVIGNLGAMRYDATEVMQGVTEVLAYGTAVQVERIS